MFDKVLVGQGYFDGVEVFALDIFDQGHLHHVLVVDGADVGRDAVEARNLRSAPTAFASDNLVVAILHLAQGDGLDNTDLANAFGQFLEGRGVKLAARLVGVGLYLRDGHFADGGGTAGVHFLFDGNERIESASERGEFLMGCHFDGRFWRGFVCC